ncbi:MAG: hypothetical protein Q9227_003930 [Pyrenula ochraceoflavens]
MVTLRNPVRIKTVGAGPAQSVAINNYTLIEDARTRNATGTWMVRDLPNELTNNGVKLVGSAHFEAWGTGMLKAASISDSRLLSIEIELTANNWHAPQLLSLYSVRGDNERLVQELAHGGWMVVASVMFREKYCQHGVEHVLGQGEGCPLCLILGNTADRRWRVKEGASAIT